MAPARGLTVVKLGGSHAFSPHLRPWLAALAQCAGQVVLVPGGGPFADAVRAAQPKIGFDNRTAHHMALLAMDQYGRALASLDPALLVADSLAAIRRAARAGTVPVWSPTRMVLAATDVPASWDVTADSLAAWLASRLGAPRLFLIKHADGIADAAAADDLVAAGLIDAALPRYLAGGKVAASLLGPGEHAALAASLRAGAGASVGRRIVLR